MSGRVDSAADDYFSVLKSPNATASEKHEAIRALGALGDPAVVPRLIWLLQRRHSFGGLAPAIAVALGEIGDDRAVVPLLEYLEDPQLWNSDDAVISTARSIGMIGGDRAVTGLVDFVTSHLKLTSDQKAVGFAQALAMTRDPRAFDSIAALLSGRRDVDAMKSIAESLVVLGDDRAGPLLGAELERLLNYDWSGSRPVQSRIEAITGVLAGQSDPARIPILIRVVQSGPYQAKYVAAKALATVPDQRTLEVVETFVAKSGHGLAQHLKPQIKAMRKAVRRSGK